MADRIVIKGAREHNLKNIDLEIPRDRLVVITGLSGSGKSSLAFDTIYAEGQRRYVESLSAYARQFLEQMEKPDVDSIEGLSPAISIEQKTTSRNPRSTVATITEIYDYLRLLFARVGHAFCYNCGREITQQSVQQIVDRIMGWPDGARIHVLAPIVRDRKGEYRKELSEMKRAGFVRVKIDGKLYELVTPPGKFIPHDLMDAVASLLINAKSVEVVAENSNDLAQFGLDHPKSVITVEGTGQPQPIKLAFGNENPTHTAIYAQIEGIQKVFLLGVNIEYYQSLMFQWVEGKQGKNA